MTYYSPQAAFVKGEVDPVLHSRSDIDFWQVALKECTNFQVLVQGGLRRRSGTLFVTEVADSTKKSALLPFVFNSEQAYVLDVNGGGTVRFVSDRAYLLSGVSPYAISHPWAEGDLLRLSTAQANDVMYVVHKGYAPREIRRSGDIDWSIGETVFKDGPYLPEKTEGTTLTPAERGSLTPIMTSNTAPSGTVTTGPLGSGSTSSMSDPWMVFDADDSTESKGSDGATPGYIAYQLASDAAICDHYSVTATPHADVLETTPVAWVIEGSNDGSAWVVLDQKDGESGWQVGETRYFDFANKTAYSNYRFRWKSADGSEHSRARIAEIRLNRAGDDQTPFNLTASSTDGINDGKGFQSTDIGRSIRLMGGDGKWRWARIASVTSTTVVKIRLYGHVLPTLDPIGRWQLGTFSVEGGWPGSTTLYDERLMFARTNAQPLTIFGSKQSQFDDFGVSDPAEETDGLSLTLLSSNMNEILWISDDDDLVSGSAGQIRSIGPADFTKAFSATNLTQKKGPTNGAFHLQPITVGGVTLYVAAGGKKIRELVLGDQNRYVAPDLSVLFSHMLKAGIVDWAFADNPDPTIYAVNGNGELIAVAYDRDQKVVGASRFTIAGGFVESVAAVPGVTEGNTDVYLVVKRTINGETKRYIEVLDDPFDAKIKGVEDAFFVDCGLKYDGSAISTLTGLDHLEGEDVVALADGGFVEGLTVEDGSVALPYAAEKISIGLAYMSRAVTLPVSGPQQDGSLFGRRVNVIAPAIDVLESGSLKCGALGSDSFSPAVEEQLANRGDEQFGSPVGLISGFVHCEIEGSWADGGGSVVMGTDAPLPLLIRSIVMQLDTEP